MCQVCCCPNLDSSDLKHSLRYYEGISELLSLA